MSPITRKSMSKLVMQPSFRAVGQTHVKWYTFEKPENKRQMYISQAHNLESKRGPLQRQNIFPAILGGVSELKKGGKINTPCALASFELLV